MRYVISIERVHDGAKAAHMFEDDQVAGARFDFIAKRAHELWKTVNLASELKERDHAKQVMYPSNPIEQEFTNRARREFYEHLHKRWESEPSSKMFPWITPNTWEIQEPETTEDGTTHRAILKHDHSLDAIVYGVFPAKSAEKGAKNNGENPETD